jgi:hypothetical protein
MVVAVLPSPGSYAYDYTSILKTTYTLDIYIK